MKKQLRTCAVILALILALSTYAFAEPIPETEDNDLPVGNVFVFIKR